MGLIARIVACAVVLLFADSAMAACAVTNNFVAGNAAVADDVDQNFTDLRTCIETLQGLDTVSEMQTAEGINIIVATEIDTLAELNALIGDGDVQPLEATLTDIADGTIAEDLANTANPWADNEVSDTLTLGASAVASTAAANDSDTSPATTAFVQQEINGAGGTDLTCASGSCDVDATVARTADLAAYTTGTSTPTDGSTACNTGDMHLETDAFKIYFCVDGSTDDWYGVAITDTP